MMITMTSPPADLPAPIDREPEVQAPPDPWAEYPLPEVLFAPEGLFRWTSQGDAWNGGPYSIHEDDFLAWLDAQGEGRAGIQGDGESCPLANAFRQEFAPLWRHLDMQGVNDPYWINGIFDNTVGRSWMKTFIQLVDHGWELGALPPGERKVSAPQARALFQEALLE